MPKYQFLWAEENHNYYDFELILLNYNERSRKNWNVTGISNALIFGRGFHADFYLSEEDIKREENEWYNLLTNERKFKLVLKAITSSSKEMIKEIKKLLSFNLSELDNEKLWKLYDDYGGKFSKLGEVFNGYIISEPYRIAKLERELLSFLKKKTIVDANNLFELLTTPTKTVTFSSKGNKLLNGSLFELIGDEESTIDHNLINEPVYEEKKVDTKEKDRKIKELKLPKIIKQIVKVFSILGHERFKMRCVWMSALYYNELFLIEFKKRYSINKKELRLYDLSEIENLVRFGKKLSKEKISEREDGFLKILKNKKIYTYEGKTAQRKLETLISKEERKEEVEGQVACRGYIVGKVIVLSYKDSKTHAAKIKNMQKGEILVTEMTKPNLIIACEKAGAIITDEGGILCHAAIISRELNIPCVIGTKIATSCFKDGDFVEVDAIKGKVKRISYDEYLFKIKTTKIPQHFQSQP